MVPGRSATLRPDTRKELAATAVLAVPLHEASLKARDGGPGDEPEDVAAGIWGGHVPLRLVAGGAGARRRRARARCPTTSRPVARATRRASAAR